MFRIAHVVRRFASNDRDETEKAVWNTVLSQRKKGLNAEILATAAVSVPGNEFCQGVRIRRFHHWYPYFPMSANLRAILDKKGGNPFVPSLFRTLRKESYNLIHIHCGGRMAQLSAAAAVRRTVPCVITLHDGTEDVPKAELQRMAKSVKGKIHYGEVIDLMLKRCCDPIEIADAVICLNRNDEAILKEKYPGVRIVYLPNGVDDETFRIPSRLSVRQEWLLPAERNLIVCTAQIDQPKNQLIVLRLLADEEQSHLLLIDPTMASKHGQGEIMALAEKLDVSRRITVISGLSPQDPRLKAILYEADFFLLSAFHEQFSIAALEAMAAGTPIIASDAGDQQDLIVNERNGLLFAPGDYDGLRKASRRLKDNPDFREKLIRQAAQDVRKYSWDSRMEKLVLLYRELVYGRSRNSLPGQIKKF